MHENALISLIHERYRATHGAVPAADYPVYLSIGTPESPKAVLGYRTADTAPLFLEVYLGRPIEVVLSEHFGRPVPRARIVEIGDHASTRATATIGLWREAAAALAGQADIAVAVLTRPLRSMFARLKLDLVELAPASIEALGPAGPAWGRYYASDPIVCAGDIASCRRRLEPAVRG